MIASYQLSVSVVRSVVRIMKKYFVYIACFSCNNVMS